MWWTKGLCTVEVKKIVALEASLDMKEGENRQMWGPESFLNSASTGEQKV